MKIKSDPWSSKISQPPQIPHGMLLCPIIYMRLYACSSRLRILIVYQAFDTSSEISMLFGWLVLQELS